MMVKNQADDPQSISKLLRRTTTVTLIGLGGEGSGRQVSKKNCQATQFAS